MTAQPLTGQPLLNCSHPGALLTLLLLVFNFPLRLIVPKETTSSLQAACALGRQVLSPGAPMGALTTGLLHNPAPASGGDASKDCSPLGLAEGPLEGRGAGCPNEQFSHHSQGVWFVISGQHEPSEEKAG